MKCKAIRQTDKSLTYKQEMAKAELKIFGKSHEGKLLEELVDMLTHFVEKHCDKVVIVPQSGGKFGLKFSNGADADIELTRYGVAKSRTYLMEEQMETDLNMGIFAHNEMLFAYAMLDAGLNPSAETHKVEVDKIRRSWNPYGEIVEETITLEGTIEEIFDEYTTINDRLKYCNDDWYRFHNEKLRKVYQVFLDKYKGNFFLDNAVRRGCIID